jgi:hypothetical protein
LPNNEWAVQRRGGAESRANNVIYIGRASFRMEPAPVTADEIVGPISPPFAALDHDADAQHAAGEDVEPPYLRLRTLVDETMVRENQPSPYPPDLDLTEFATLSENTGVEVRGDAPPPLPRTLIADVASFPHAMPTSIEPATELVVAAESRLSLSRTRLVGWGAVAFCAGLLASAGAHMLVAPARLGPTANAATAAGSQNVAPAAPAASPTAPATVVAVTPAPAIAVVPVPAPAAEAPVAKSSAPETARAEAPPVALAASPAAIRTRSGANALSRGQTRARGKMRSRGGSASAAEIGGETDAPSSDAPAAEAAPAPATRPTHPAAGWVDPFAQ